MCSYEDKLNRKAVRLWLRSVAQNRSYSRQRTIKFYLHVEESGAHHSKVPKTFRTNAQLSFVEATWIFLPMYMVRDSVLANLRMRKLNNKCVAPLDDVEETRPSKWHQRVLHLVNPMWIFSPRIWDFSSRVAAHAPTKSQSNSTSGRGARASYQTMLPEISARRSLLWVKLQIPVARQGGREMSAPRPRVTDPFHPLSSIPR